MTIKKHFCQYCNEPIHFDPAFKSRNNKFLPLSTDGIRHWCNENPLYKAKKLKQWQNRQRVPITTDPKNNMQIPQKSQPLVKPDNSNNNSIINKQFQHYTPRKIEELRLAARKRLEELKVQWVNEEEALKRQLTGQRATTTLALATNQLIN